MNHEYNSIIFTVANLLNREYYEYYNFRNESNELLHSEQWSGFFLSWLRFASSKPYVKASMLKRGVQERPLHHLINVDGSTV